MVSVMAYQPTSSVNGETETFFFKFSLRFTQFAGHGVYPVIVTGQENGQGNTSYRGFHIQLQRLSEMLLHIYFPLHKHHPKIQSRKNSMDHSTECIITAYSLPDKCYAPMPQRKVLCQKGQWKHKGSKENAKEDISLLQYMQHQLPNHKYCHQCNSKCQKAEALIHGQTATRSPNAYHLQQHTDITMMFVNFLST